MPSHSEERYSSHTVKELFMLVADIKHYPDFLPWVSASRIISETDHEIVADLIVGFKGFREKYRSLVTLCPQESEQEEASIAVSLIEGPFDYLTNHWLFTPDPKGGTCIHFDIDFAFRSKLFEKMIGGVFEKAQQKMITAFEARADALFGPGN